MNPREKILAFIDELERVIDKSIEAMDASTARIDELEAENASLADDLNEALARIEALEKALRKIADAPAWGAPDRWETTPFEVRQLARAALTPEREK
jgi:FtsZ-binding cell division protein ZapB